MKTLLGYLWEVSDEYEVCKSNHAGWIIWHGFKKMLSILKGKANSSNKSQPDKEKTVFLNHLALDSLCKAWRCQLEAR